MKDQPASPAPDRRPRPSMHIGTPLSPSATKVMLLGSGELGKEVIIALQRLGVEVIAVDRYANAPGHQVAHRAHVIAMTDGGALRRLIEQERPQLIVPEIEAIATDVLAAIELEGLAQVIPTARAVQLTMNREGIRRLAAEDLGLPTSPYRFADSLDALQTAIETAPGIGYPVRREARDVVVRQGPDAGARAGRRGGGVAVCRKRGPRPRQPPHRRGVHRFRLRDHAAHRPGARCERRRADALLRTDRTPAGERRLRRVVAAAADVAGRAGPVTRNRRPGDDGARRPRNLRRRALRQGRRRLVLRGEPPSARHRDGDDVHAGAERIRAARPRHPRLARRRAPDRARRVGGRSTAASRRAASATTMSRTRWRCPAPTCGSSASPRRTRSGGWAWRSPRRPASTKHASARPNARGA